MDYAEELRSKLLDAYADKVAYGFSIKPQPVAGVGLSEADLLENRAYWLHALGIPATVDTLRYPTQVHGSQWLTASETVHAEADAIWLDVPKLPAVVFSADCTPILLYAPDIHQGMALHCGWRSTAQSLAKKGAAHLVAQGAEVTELIAVIGPALSFDGFEVGEEVIDQLKTTLGEGDCLEVWASMDEQTQKWHASVPLVNALQLASIGVEQVEIMPFATDTHPDWFWSFRAGDWQRQGAFLLLR
ncbi:MAG: polyphenol oxidase family protein [Candidatus Melainabacteria bacterium]|nr:polyphenol oxidase family protein [Candidatus Melainabacteria bacterium]